MLESILNQPAFQDIDIIVKCKKYSDFKKQLTEIQQNYVLDLKMAPYTKIKTKQQAIPFDLIFRSKLFVNFYGYKMDQLKDEDYRDLYLHWIQRMDQIFRKNPKQRYTVIYYHSMSSSISPYLFIKESFKKLPIQYYALLDKIYIVESNFLIRNASIFQFNRLHKLYFRRCLFLENLKDLGKIDEIKQNQVLESIPEVLALEQNLSDKKGKKNKDDKTMKKQEMQVPKNPPFPIKKDCLTILLSEHRLNENNLPIYLQTLINTIRKYPQIMKLEGIFRKSGSIQEEEQIIEDLSHLQKAEILKKYQTKNYSGYAVAGVIKKFFTKLEKPIVPYAVYNWIMGLKEIGEQEQNQIVKEILMAIPPLNKSIILYVMSFVRSQVLQFKEQNKMNYYNMSVVFSPCFFRPQTESFQDLINSGRYASILKILFNNFETIVGKSEPCSPTKKSENENRGSKGSKGSRQSKGQNQTSLTPLNTNI